MTAIPFSLRWGASVHDACAMAGLGHTKMYDLINTGQVETVKIGRRRIVVIRSLMALIDPKAAAGPPIAGKPE